MPTRRRSSATISVWVFPFTGLSEHFQLEPPVDGRYFMDRLASANQRDYRGSAQAGTLGKRLISSLETPRVYGTLSSAKARRPETPIGRDNSAPWARQQRVPSHKNARSRSHCGSLVNASRVVLYSQSREVTGRAACGLSIRLWTTVLSSRRKISPLQLTRSGGRLLAGCSGSRGLVQRLLRCRRYRAQVWFRQYRTTSAGEGRQSDLHTMIQRAQEQLERRKNYKFLDEDGESYVGREIQFELATPIGVEGPGIRPLLLRYGVRVEFLDAITQDIERYGRQASTVGFPVGSCRTSVARDARTSKTRVEPESGDHANRVVVLQRSSALELEAGSHTAHLPRNPPTGLGSRVHSSDLSHQAQPTTCSCGWLTRSGTAQG